MIARLSGRIVEKAPGHLIVDVGGVGYRVSIPLSTFEALSNPDDAVALRIHTHVREDSLALYGFATGEEQELFEQLIGISGIGPKLALAILSGLPMAALRQAILDGDTARLKRIPGVGARTADRVVLELKDLLAKRRSGERAGAAAAPRAGVRRDAVMALVNLGYRDAQAEEAVSAAMNTLPDAPEAAVPPGALADALPEVLRRSLRYLAS